MKRNPRTLTQERLREVLSYNEQTGVFRWIARPSIRCVVGAEAGAVGSRGYRHIAVDGVRYTASHLAWLYVRGAWPRFEIDHINRDRLDNRISNLRDVSHVQNIVNSRGSDSPRTASGVRGVYAMRGKPGRYKVAVKDFGKLRQLGSGLDFDEAKAVSDKFFAERLAKFEKARLESS